MRAILLSGVVVLFCGCGGGSGGAGGALDGFEVTIQKTAVAGTTIEVEIRALRRGTTNTEFSGDILFQTTDASAQHDPSNSFEPADEGVIRMSVEFRQARRHFVTVISTTLGIAGKGAIDIGPGPQTRFDFDIAPIQPSAAGRPFDGETSVRAVDAHGNAVTGYDAALDPVTISADPDDGVITGLGSQGGDVLDRPSDFRDGVAVLTGEMMFTWVGNEPMHRFKAESASGMVGMSGPVEIVATGQGRLVGDEQRFNNLRTVGMAAGDVDGDGDQDLACATVQGDRNTIFLNDGDGNFTDSGNDLGSEVMHDMAFGDVDGDGDLDLVCAKGRWTSDALWLNDGSGSFTASAVDVGRESAAVALTDLDGDGDVDLLTSRFGGLEARLNAGGGTFPTVRQIGAVYERDFAIGDLDGDGDTDVVVGRGQGRNNEVWLNDGAGNFTPGATFDNGPTGPIAVGDVDADGDLDVCCGNYAYGNTVWLNNGTGAFTDSGNSLGNHCTTALLVSDVDGDGDLDMIESTESLNDFVWTNNANVYTINRPALEDLSLGNTGCSAAVDIDGDGDEDFIQGGLWALDENFAVRHGDRVYRNR